MYDHVTIRVSKIEVARRFYEPALAALGYGEPVFGEGFFEWEDLSIAQARDDRPVTRDLHIALAAKSRADVDEWWRVMTGSGHPDDGAPGPRPQYSEDYYGAFVRDPDGNSVEAVHHGGSRGPTNRIDHLWIGVRDLDATKGFYATIAPVSGFRIAGERPERFHIAGGEGSSAFVQDGRPPTQNVHLAFGAGENAVVDEFHRVALAAGYRDNGAPGERRYHPGYYGAFVLDPDGNNVEVVCHNR